MENNLIPDEKYFQNHIVEELCKNPFYKERQSSDFDLGAMCDRDELLRFMRAQPDSWKRLVSRSNNDEQAALSKVIKRYNDRLNSGESIIHLLNGQESREFKVEGVRLRLVQYRPQLAADDSEFVQLYKQNRFAVVKEFRYSLVDKDKNNRIDLVWLINGLPIMTAELKNELSSTHWNYTDAINQYREDRDPENRFLKTCLVHFAVDNNYAFMTTRLKGIKTWFLPFNKDVKNPPVSDDYATAYLWREIWQPDSLLCLLEHFIKNYDEKLENGKTENKTVFPRFHQLRAVNNLVQWSIENGAGHNYLIEHSAGSGKTKSMAWLAHRLANTIGTDRKPVYDSIIMVTDRVVLNANMADDVNYFSQTAGLVKDIRRGSQNLAAAIDAGGRIIVCTVQKFSYALASLRREKARRYAVIIDEAHTAMGSESTKDIVNALSTDEELKARLLQKDASCESNVDALLAGIQSMRQMPEHISFFAFTATPKDRTYQLFGIKTPDGKNRVAHDLYTMRQAIDEKFILDVLQNYVTYQTMFEYVEKGFEPQPDGRIAIKNHNGEIIKYISQEEYEKKKSVRLILKHLSKEEKVMRDKAEFALNHFMEKSAHKIDGKAKAMFVCESREAVVRYKMIFDQLIKEHYNNSIKTLGAISGSIDIDGISYDEEKMNGDGIKDNGIRTTFRLPEYRILIVADKFQTGFDQPLLHTMYVDKALGGVNAIQTLSRLNRICPPHKEDTCVIDFRNDAADIKEVFETYHYGASLEGEFQPEMLYTFRTKLRTYQVYTESQIKAVVECLLTGKHLETVPAILKAIVDENVAPKDDNVKDEFRKEVSRYIRAYGFLAQLLTFIDTDLESEYLFLKALYGYLPFTKDTLPMDILNKIDLNKVDIKNLTHEGEIKLGEGEALTPRYDKIKKKTEDETATLPEILDIVNEASKLYFEEHDAQIRPITDEITSDPEVREAFSADNNYDDLRSLLVEKIREKVGTQTNDYLQFLSFVLDGNSPIGRDYIVGLFNLITQITRQEQNLPLDLELLKTKIVEDVQGEFADLQRFIRPVAEVADFMFKALQKSTLPKYDGVNDIIANSLNVVFCSETLRLVDRRSHFNGLISKFEVYLKKLYYIINNSEITNREGSTDSTLSNAIFAFRCLRGLQNNSDSRYQKFNNYLNLVRQWRNDEAHAAPNAGEDDIKTATHILVTMYMFVTSQVTTDLEGAME